MNEEITKVCQLLKKHLIDSSVESFGILHQSLFLEFRTKNLGDVSFYIDTTLKIKPILEVSNITIEEYNILCLNRINLKKVINIIIDENYDLSICFEEGIVLTFFANNQPTDEVWTFRNATTDIHSSEYVNIIALSNGGYAIWG